MRVVAESFLGVRYTAHVSLDRSLSEYRVEFTCETEFPHECACSSASDRVDEAAAQRLVAAVASLRDEGENATCCDRPWTEIRLIFDDGRRKDLIVGGAPLDLQAIVGFSCPED